MKKKTLLSLSFAFLSANLATAGLYFQDDKACMPVTLSCAHTILCFEVGEDFIDQALDADEVFCS